MCYIFGINCSCQEILHKCLARYLCYHKFDVLKPMLLTLDCCMFLSLANLLFLLRESTEKNLNGVKLCTCT